MGSRGALGTQRWALNQGLWEGEMNGFLKEVNGRQEGAGAGSGTAETECREVKFCLTWIGQSHRLERACQVEGK